MYSVSNILTNTGYPSWIVNHPIFKDVSIYDKIFPKKGLQNGTDPLKTLLAEKELHNFVNDLILISSKAITRLSDREPSPIICALIKFFSNLTSIDYLDVTRENKISISLSEDISDSDGKIVFRKGSSLFSLLEKFSELELGTNIFAYDSFKAFSRLNIPLSSAEIVFSTDPWDIATMSMRGIATCQSWTGEYRQSVIGSMLDPYVAIIYLASKGKSTEYGSKMLFRAVVRFAVDNTGSPGKKPPVLIIDHVYPEPFEEVLDLFSEYLKEKSGLKVLYAPDIEYDIHDGLYFLPHARIREIFKYYSEEQKFTVPIPLEDSIRSYQNITIKDKPTTAPTVDTLKIAKEKIREVFIASLIQHSSTTGIELSRFSSSKINTLLAIKNRNFSFQNQLKIAIRTFANKLIREIDFDERLDESSYRIKLYLNYFHKRNYLLESMSSQVSQWNGSLSLKKSAALTRRDFVMIMQQAMQQADQALKAELKAFFAARRVDNRPTSD